MKELALRTSEFEYVNRILENFYRMNILNGKKEMCHEYKNMRGTSVSVRWDRSSRRFGDEL